MVTLCIKPRGLVTVNQGAKVDALKSEWPDFATMRRLAMGVGAEAIDDRRQAKAPPHQQTRKQVFAKAADPWRALGTSAACERDTVLGRRVRGLLARSHKNIAVVALANKMARIAWAVPQRRERFAVGGLSAAV
jgi:hypothetical protein